MGKSNYWIKLYQEFLASDCGRSSEQMGQLGEVGFLSCLPQVAERNFPRLMDAAGECLL
jgi:hypothetical protein